MSEELCVSVCISQSFFVFVFIKVRIPYEKEWENHMALARLSGFSVPCVPGFVTFVF